MPSSDRLAQLQALLDFVANAPEDPIIIAMDCNDHCEKMASLAERVANGETLEDILPELQEHMRYWGDCREEFMALVAVLKAEMLAQ
ncbi:MAG: hypothetical protein NZ750_02060 [Anaerolineae bacterium]|nr:hypothetical protein [Anaerolineae bacterium]MDW8173536.1 hypothetical protein [Anaerolineae bacterium]